MKYKGHFDGACNPNPGAIGLGISINDDAGQEIDYGYMPKGTGTNNEAEYLAVLLLLQRALHMGITSIECVGDSKLVVNQLNGTYRINQDSLLKLHGKVMHLVNQFDSCEFLWVRRQHNTRADELSKMALETNESFFSQAPTITKKAAQAPSEAPKAEHVNRIPVVKTLTDGRIFISDSRGISILEPRSRTCTCSCFHKHKSCFHLNTFLRLKHKPQKVALIG
ncbi:ribonuclease HI family protein [Alteromonas gilva]|uniref:Ribonuclease HI family protein n=1 Tax=Alteromonas gilva TaxID=2987522 RepID=A0ABT5L7F5_9ALTE|nr:ribonuclease HI family protein [Alteromonas gilva]MDC8832966.1 ribonuclease HI family protein [Alteromonas gilva]